MVFPIFNMKVLTPKTSIKLVNTPDKNTRIMKLLKYLNVNIRGAWKITPHRNVKDYPDHKV